MVKKKVLHGQLRTIEWELTLLTSGLINSEYASSPGSRAYCYHVEHIFPSLMVAVILIVPACGGMAKLTWLALCTLYVLLQAPSFCRYSFLPVSEMTYTVSNGTLNPSIPYLFLCGRLLSVYLSWQRFSSLTLLVKQEKGIRPVKTGRVWALGL